MLREQNGRPAKIRYRELITHLPYVQHGLPRAVKAIFRQNLDNNSLDHFITYQARIKIKHIKIITNPA